VENHKYPPEELLGIALEVNHGEYIGEEILSENDVIQVCELLAERKEARVKPLQP